MAMSIDDKLGRNRFHADDNYAHIELNENCTDMEMIKRVVMACPAQLYRLDEGGKLSFNYEGCLECGTCRVLAHDNVLKKWDHPMGGMGVEFRMG
ncbi:MAG: 4Fe-4S dicluster domain-containing protein [Eubacterium sp.]|nr:4Fe-4S dicluster domain-containing protein [Eubacterium sp.]